MFKLETRLCRVYLKGGPVGFTVFNEYQYLILFLTYQRKIITLCHFKACSVKMHGCFSCKDAKQNILEKPSNFGTKMVLLI